MTVRSTPKDIYFKGKPNSEDIRHLLKEMVDSGVSDETAQVFGSLSVTPPEIRLANALNHTLGILVDRNVHHVITDGLLGFESAALVELDELNFSKRSSVTARGLLCVKERYAMVRAIRGYFGSARIEENSQLRV